MARLKGSTEWTPIYMLVVLVIAAILIITLIKPIIRAGGDAASQNLEDSRTLAQSALFLLGR
ncbi:MAG: hypothetical protein V1787_05080 [Candidatus Micrarchaeota archaeon]